MATIFRRLLFRKEATLEPQAQTLYQTAAIVAIGSFQPFSVRYLTLLEDVDVKRWDLLVTIAGVFVAVLRLAQLHPKQASSLIEIVLSDLDETALFVFKRLSTIL